MRERPLARAVRRVGLSGELSRKCDRPALHSQRRMAGMRLAPDPLRAFFREQVERDCAHRRDGCELDQTFRLGVRDGRRRPSQRLEAGNQ